MKKIKHIKKKHIIFTLLILFIFFFFYIITTSKAETPKQDSIKTEATKILNVVNQKGSIDVSTISKSNITKFLSTALTTNYKSLKIITNNDENYIELVGKNDWNNKVVCGTINNLEVKTGSSCDYDFTSPVITLLGDSIIYITIGSTYVDAGATSNDNVDGNITSKIITTGKVNTYTVGEYNITYNVSDSSNNSAKEVVRKVYVIDNTDTTNPIVTFKTNGNTTYMQTNSTKVTITDNAAVNNSSLKYLWTTSTTTPSKSSFVTSFTNGSTISTPIGVSGNYYLWIKATDTSNNTIIKCSKAFNLDNIAPVITLNGTSTVNMDRLSTYSDLGAVATDNIDDNISNVNVVSNINSNVAGTYTVTYSATDKAGNTSTISRTVKVIYTNADTSGAATPELSSNMIPVYYDSIANIWKKADAQNQLGTYEWYDYTNKMWANAVTVTEATRSAYQNAVVGTPIAEADILTYMVWIPRYSYYIATSGTTTPSSIAIKFENKTSAKSTGDAITTYRTHPAFTFGTEELNGIWVGKFEPSPDPITNSGCYNTRNVGACDSLTISLRIKAKVNTWQNAKVLTYYTVIKNMTSIGNIYGYVDSEVDTHMMKNSEWGAVAYLAYSIYGKNSEVWINNNTVKAGKSGSSVSAASYGGVDAATYDYNTTYGVNASTTGTIYGIYDMSGGTYEYVMADYNLYSGYSSYNNSGFNGYNTSDGTTTVGMAFPDSKYYNLYTTLISSTACGGNICYGEALSETAGWNNDSSDFHPATSGPWLIRGNGGSSGVAAGIFAYEFYVGGCSSHTTARIVITNN